MSGNQGDVGTRKHLMIKVDFVILSHFISFSAGSPLPSTYLYKLITKNILNLAQTH